MFQGVEFYSYVNLLGFLSIRNTYTVDGENKIVNKYQYL